MLVSEQELAQGIRHAYPEVQLIVERSGAVGIAALLAGRVANIDMALHKRLVSKQVSEDGS